MIALRERLCEAIRVAPDTMPFAGELIEVRQDATDWEGAAERLLHNFAMTLLVPARHYEAVASLGRPDAHRRPARLLSCL